MSDRTRKGEEEVGSELQSGISRRGFLQAGGFLLVSASAPELLVGCGSSDPDGAPPGEDSRVSVIRPDDLFVAELAFFNLRRVGADKLVRDVSSQPAYIVVHLPRQHILERTVDEDADPPQPPVDSLISGPSRLVFKAPDGVDELTYSLSALLSSVTAWDLAVALNATPPPGLEPKNALLVPHELGAHPSARDVIRRQRFRRQSRVLAVHVPELVTLDGPGDLASPSVPAKPVEPDDLETSIELPTRLLMSPNKYARFAHASEPVVSSEERVELWHTRLATVTASNEVDERRSDLRTIRALWARGQPFSTSDPAASTDADDVPFPASLTARDRNEIVHASSNFTLEPAVNAPDTPPEPIEVDRLMLTPLGGYLEASGSWAPKQGLSLEAWSHRATLGRDHYVRVVTAGYLFPYGHRASLVTISERKILAPPRVAYLWKRSFLIIREPVRRYVDGAQLAGLGKSLRQLPFASVAFRELVSPNLDNPNSKQDPFLPTIAQKVYRFPVTCIDRDGATTQTEIAAVWVPGRPEETWSGQVAASAEVERKFAGKNEDPTFAEVFAPCPPPALPTEACGGSVPWADDVNAFAA